MRCSNAIQTDADLGWALTVQTRNIFGACCARAASGQAAAAPPSAASNSRRLMVTVIRPSREGCVKGTVPRHERVVLPFKEGLRPQSSASTALLPSPALGERRHCCLGH